MATYAIGDLQGCLDPLLRLLDLCRFDPAQDRLWFTGDLVNRGPQSLETLRFVRDLGERAVTVLGNHDLYLLMAAHGSARKHGADDTIAPILNAPDREELLDWLRHQRLCHVEGKYCLVHAGLLPQWSADDARRLASEVEAALQGEAYTDLLDHMWGSQPGAWSDDLQGWDRLRVVINAMTRMRFCTPAGAMEFHSKGETGDAPPGYLPWFEAPGRKSADAILVVGHWSALGLRLAPNLLALDTGYLWGGQLTALRLEDRALFQIPAPAGRPRG